MYSHDSYLNGTIIYIIIAIQWQLLHVVSETISSHCIASVLYGLIHLHQVQQEALYHSLFAELSAKLERNSPN